MAYNEFSVDGLIQQFQIRVQESSDVFGCYPRVPISDLLRLQLDEYLPLALDISTEKARAEFIIAPVLGEVRRQFQKRISLFSGVEFNADPEHHLRGVCDFLISLDPWQFTVRAPVVAIVEAKNESIKAGLGQCAAEMLGVQRFNRERGNEIPTVYGAVTTGDNWRFLRLRDTLLDVDSVEYLIYDVERIVGILVGAIQSALDVTAPEARG